MLFRPWYSELKIYLFYGRKGSGKSLFQARLALKLFRDYAAQEKRYPDLPHRAYYSNQKFSPDIEKKELKKHLFYWTNPRQLYKVRNADIGWDEIGKDLPAGSWRDTPKDLRQVFSHLRKRGNRLFANTQVFEDIDISFRRQIDKAYRIQKLVGSRDISASLPPVKNVWGLSTWREFDPRIVEFEWNEQKREEKQEEVKTSIWPHFFMISRELVNAYDTTMELPAYKPDKLDEIILVCSKGKRCADYDKKNHEPHTIIRHVPI